MKKITILIACMLMASLLLCSAASAETITALASEVNPEHLEKTASYARVLGCDKEKDTLAVELISPEVFSREDVQALKVGDSIYTGGQEIVIKTLKRDDDYGIVVINEGDYEFAEGSVYLYEDADGNFRPEVYDDYTYVSLGVFSFPVKESLLFLDYINESTGDMLFLPIVFTADEFLDRLANSSVSLNANNAYVVFDGEGNLAAVSRYYVPWQ